MAGVSRRATKGRSGRWRLALPLALAVVLAGCGPADTDARAGDRTAALASWKSFPVDANPRPLLLLDDYVLTPRTGFASVEDKEAFSSGAFDLAVRLPPAPASAHGYPIVSASAALDRLRATSAPMPPTTRLRIVKVTLGQARFGTDRGPRLLPAWRIGLGRVADPAWVLAVGSSALWPFDPNSARGAHSGERATLQPDGRTLTYHFVGRSAGPPPCGGGYQAHAVEAATTVTITLQGVPQHEVGQQQPTQSVPEGAAVACDTAGHFRTVTVQLATPLGGRVLLDADLTPIAVTSR